MSSPAPSRRDGTPVVASADTFARLLRAGSEAAETVAEAVERVGGTRVADSLRRAARPESLGKTLAPLTRRLEDARQDVEKIVGGLVEKGRLTWEEGTRLREDVGLVFRESLADVVGSVRDIASRLSPGTQPELAKEIGDLKTRLAQLESLAKSAFPAESPKPLARGAPRRPPPAPRQERTSASRTEKENSMKTTARKTASKLPFNVPAPVEKALKTAGTPLRRLQRQGEERRRQDRKAGQGRGQGPQEERPVSREGPARVRGGSHGVGPRLRPEAPGERRQGRRRRAGPRPEGGAEAARRAEGVAKNVTETVGTAVEKRPSQPERPDPQGAPLALGQGGRPRQEDRRAEDPEGPAREAKRRAEPVRNRIDFEAPPARRRLFRSKKTDGRPTVDSPGPRLPGTRPSERTFKAFPSPIRKRLGVVCAGGGVTGAIYEIGALAALEDRLENVSINDFDVFVGVSAGAYISALLANGVTPGVLFRNVTRSAGTRTDIDDLALFRLNLGEIAGRLATAPFTVLDAAWDFYKNRRETTLTDLVQSLGQLLPVRAVPERGARGVDAEVAVAVGAARTTSGSSRRPSASSP